MKANKNSIHAKLYKFTFKNELPSNLCPYFWKLLFAVLVFIPNLIFQLPILLYSIFKDPNMICNERRIHGLMINIVLIMSYFFLNGNIHLFKAIFNFYSYNSEIANITLGIYFFSITLILIFLILNWKYNNQYKPDGVITSFIKAKYNNYCPKINWN